MTEISDTIFAQATGAGRAGVAVIRISGTDAGSLLDRLTRPRPRPRQATLRRLLDGNGDPLDRGLVLWFPKPGSYTGEDCAELHLHGGPAVIEAVSEVLRLSGGRPADPGEFTQRAFMAGRLDLIEAEGIADLIDAETDAQRRQALAQSSGELSRVYQSWSDRLKRLLATQEAMIDFPDETNDAVSDRLVADILELEKTLAAHLSDGRRGEALRRGLVIAVVGAPNVGKSSLVNVVAGRDVSIVSERVGTTRDVIETRLVLSGVPVTLVDTAGVRDSEDEVEREGVRRAKQSAANADLLMLVTCGGERPPADEMPALWVANKIDLLPAPLEAIGVSARTGEGIEALRHHLEAAVRRLAGASSLPVLTRVRHRDCVQTAADRLGAARMVSSPELCGEELRLAVQSLGRLTGAVGVEDILDTIFSTFCIGK